MSQQSKAFHSVIFTKNGTSKNSWDNFHLIPTARPDIPLPQRSFKYVDVPGRNGSIDLSNYLTGGAYYADRSGSFEFVVVQEYGGKIIDSRSWIERKRELANFFDGSEMQVKLEDDSGYYYIGRVTFDANGWQTGDAYSSANITYRFKPFKYNASTGQEAGI